MNTTENMKIDNVVEYSDVTHQFTKVISLSQINAVSVVSTSKVQKMHNMERALNVKTLFESDSFGLRAS